MDNLGNLRVSGERPLASELWTHFCKDFRIPQNTRSSNISTKFENGNLYIPKSQVQDQPTSVQVPESGKRTTMEHGTREKQDDMSEKDSAPLTSKPNGPAPQQSNKNSEETGWQFNSTENSPIIPEKKKDQIQNLTAYNRDWLERC